MPNPYINNTQDLTTYIRTEDSPYKSRPILGASGLSIIKKDARWSFSFSHEGLRYHGTLGTYPTVSMKEAKAAFIRKRFSVMNGYAPKPQSRKISEKTLTKLSSANPSARSKKTEKLLSTLRFSDVQGKYFHFRLEELQAKGTNKLPGKAVSRMEYLYNRYAKSVLDDIPISEISNSHLIKILSSVQSDTSRRKLQGVLSLLIKWLVQKSLLDPDHLNINWPIINGMIPRGTTSSKNFPRLALEDVPRFIKFALKPRNNFYYNLIGLSLVLLTLTVQRTGTIFCPDTTPTENEIHLFCHWENVDFYSAILSIPSSYMKVSQANGCNLPPFRVPLCKEAIWCLKQIKQLWLDVGIDLTSKDFLVPSL